MAEKDCGSGRWIGRVALVTGASSGIGAEIARRLVMQAGMHVIGVARSLEGMEQAVSATLSKEEQNRFTALRLDLADLAALEAFFSTDLPVHLSSRGLPECVHVLVNNAGVGYDAPLLSGSTADWQTMLTVNVLALSVCTRGMLNSSTTLELSRTLSNSLVQSRTFLKHSLQNFNIAILWLDPVFL